MVFYFISFHTSFHIIFVFFCRVLLARYLAETGEKSSLAGIIVISTVWDGVESMDGLEHFPNKQLYSHTLSRAIRERARMLVVIFVSKPEVKICLICRQIPRILSKFSSLPYDCEEILQVPVVNCILHTTTKCVVVSEYCF